jgi:hypothetical protein
MTTQQAAAIALAEADVRKHEEQYPGLADGTIHWTEWNESLTCWDRQEVAAEECGQALEQARSELARLSAASTSNDPAAGRMETGN